MLRQIHRPVRDRGTWIDYKEMKRSSLRHDAQITNGIGIAQNRYSTNASPGSLPHPQDQVYFDDQCMICASCGKRKETPPTKEVQTKAHTI